MIFAPDELVCFNNDASRNLYDVSISPQSIIRKLAVIINPRIIDLFKKMGTADGALKKTAARFSGVAARMIQNALVDSL
jgi:hypothetical protein